MFDDDFEDIEPYAEFDKFLGQVQQSIDDDEEIPFTLQSAIRLATDFNFNEHFWDDPEGIILEYFPQLDEEENNERQISL